MRAIVTITVTTLLCTSYALAADDLQAVYRQALQSDPTLTAAAAGRNAAAEALPEAQAALRPQLRAGGNLSYSAPSIQSGLGSDDHYQNHGYQLQLSQSLYQRGQQITLRQADATIAQADADYAGSEQQVTLQVAQSYFAVLAAEDDLETAKAEQKAIGQQLRQTQQRFEVGLSAITDVHEAQAGYDAAQARVIAASSSVEMSREALRALTGQAWGVLAPLGETVPLDPPQPANIDHWVEQALQHNPTLASRSAASRVAGDGVALARSARLPAVDLIARHSYSDNASNSDSRRFDNSVAVEVSIPLYLGGSLASGERAASYRLAQVQAQLDAERREVVRQTREAYLNVTTGISRVNATSQALSSARTALKATEAGFDVGTRTMVDVLNAQQVLFGARRDYAAARYDYLLAVLALQAAVGTLDAADIEQVSGWLQSTHRDG